MVILKQTNQNSYTIYHENTKIGFIELTESTLTQINIFPEYQEQGYGKESIQKLLQKLSHKEKLKTTAIINPKLEQILIDTGFEPSDDPTTNSYIYTFS